MALAQYLAQPTPVFLPRKFHGQRSLVGYSPWGCKESDTTEQLSMDCYMCLSSWPVCMLVAVMWPHGLKLTRLLCPWNFPGKKTGEGCYFLLQGIFPDPGLLRCRQILYQLSYHGLSCSPSFLKQRDQIQRRQTYYWVMCADKRQGC